MNKIKFLLLATLCVFCLSSCGYEDFEEQIIHIYKADSLSLSNNMIYPHSTENSVFDAESRKFYRSIDTCLIIKGRRHKLSSKWEYMFFGAMDWRITKIDVITLVDYDEKHLKGSSLNDLLSIYYWTTDNRTKIAKRLSDVGYGDIMLSYYSPYPEIQSDNALSLVFCDEESTAKLSNYEVHIEDAFGRHFVLRSE